MQPRRRVCTCQRPRLLTARPPWSCWHMIVISTAGSLAQSFYFFPFPTVSAEGLLSAIILSPWRLCHESVASPFCYSMYNCSRDFMVCIPSLLIEQQITHYYLTTVN